MRQHFTYELNEGKIRQQLKDISLPANEGAWEKFSQYSEAQPTRTSSRQLPEIKLNLSRKVMIPVAAAIVIVLLAVLLMNLININDSGAKNNKAVVEEPFVPVPQVEEPELVAPPIERSEKRQYPVKENNKALETSKPEIVKEKLATTSESPEAASESATAKKKPELHSATTQVVVKKKRGSDTENLLQPVQLPDIRPTLLTEEPEEEIRTN